VGKSRLLKLLPEQIKGKESKKGRGGKKFLSHLANEGDEGAVYGISFF